VVGVNGDAFGPGKAQLLEQIQQTGSLREAAVRLQMSYMKAWRLANRMNENFREPLLEKTRGGRAKGGTSLTLTGHRVLTIYQRMSARAVKAAQADWKALKKRLRVQPEVSPRPCEAARSPMFLAKCTRRSLPGMEETWDAKTA
jgi:molybdate transport system regulatory protein